MFQRIPEVQEVQISRILSLTFFSKKRWLSIFLLLFLYFLAGIAVNYSIQLISDPLNHFINDISDFFNRLGLYVFPLAIYYLIMLFYQNFVFFILLIIIVPIILGLPSGKQSIGKYLNTIGLGWAKVVLKNLKWVACAAILIFSMILIAYVFDLPLFGEGEPDFILIPENIIPFYNFSMILCVILWVEVVFRGIILTMLLDKYNTLKAIIINAIIFLIYHLIIGPFFTSFFYDVSYNEFISVYLSYPILIIYVLFCGIIIAYLFAKTRNLLSVLMLNFILYVFGFFPIIPP
jgi:membrane protease YdiL (CAAX protease family)